VSLIVCLRRRCTRQLSAFPHWARECSGCIPNTLGCLLRLLFQAVGTIGDFLLQAAQSQDDLALTVAPGHGGENTGADRRYTEQWPLAHVTRTLR